MSKTIMDELTKTVAHNMGLYYRENTKQWLRELNDDDGKLIRLLDFTLEVNTVVKAILNLIDKENKQAYIAGTKSVETANNELIEREKAREFEALTGLDYQAYKIEFEKGK